MPDPIDVSGYLRRLRLAHLAGHDPSVESLHALHRAHAERVPYECLEIWLGRPTSIDPAESALRIVQGRGGYCYHLNGAFSALLDALGYRVTRHVGGVQGTAEVPAGASANHLVLTVSGLPSPAAPGGRWLVDLGMGDGLHEPVPLTAGDHRQGPFRYGLRPSVAEPGGWRFDHDPRGSFLGMDFRAAATPMAAFAAKHAHLSTSPESGFVRVATVQRRDSSGADVLRGLVLTRVGDADTRTVLDDPGDYFAALADVFGLTLDDVTPAERGALWRRLSTAHERWLSEQEA
ncbi:arylamine N-acetyltransferase family protein [Krasilnikovia sp. MM14-A1259]|uniref:arylamine N-acetyltransferase family protein n=1 Tax=Krasilnikovia sp. MM14-A1259 TaxID=3373539 RepID=UPI003806713B